MANPILRIHVRDALAHVGDEEHSGDSLIPLGATDRASVHPPVGGCFQRLSAHVRTARPPAGNITDALHGE